MADAGEILEVSGLTTLSLNIPLCIVVSATCMSSMSPLSILLTSTDVGEY